MRELPTCTGHAESEKKPSGHAIRTITTVMVLVAVACSLVACGGAKAVTSPAPPPVTMIPGTQVPAPPAEFGMKVKPGVGPGGADVAGIYGYTLDPGYENDVHRLLDFYSSEMKKQGWTLRQGNEPQMTASKQFTGSQLWSKGDSWATVDVSLPDFNAELALYVNACPPTARNYCELVDSPF